jgi:O-antigen/teichoic acid export membrane protein
MKIELRSVVIRLGTMVSGFLCNIIIADLIVDKRGIAFYGIFALITSIPTLLPFIDLGFGNFIFNSFAKTESDRDLLERQTGSVFFLLIILTFLTTILMAFFTFVLEWNFLLPEGTEQNLILASFCIGVITAFSIPISLGSRKLQAEFRNNWVIAAQGMIPILTLIEIFFLIRTDVFQIFIFIVPVSNYFFTTILLFKISGISSFIKMSRRWKITEFFMEILRLGLWSVSLSSILVYIWQLPRILIEGERAPKVLGDYSIILLYLVPSISLIGAYSVSKSPTLKRLNWNSHKLSEIKRASFIAFSLALLIVVLLIVLKPITVWTRLNYPSYSGLVFLSLAILLSPFWLIPMGTLTEEKEYRTLFLCIAPIVLGFSTLFLFGVIDTIPKIFGYFILPISVSVIAIVWRILIRKVPTDVEFHRFLGQRD